MSWSQTFVISWFQWAIAAWLLLLIARRALGRVTQPVDRIRLIQWALAAALAIPCLMAVAPWPAWRLGLIPFSPDHADRLADESKSGDPIRPVIEGDSSAASRELSALPPPQSPFEASLASEFSQPPTNESDAANASIPAGSLRGADGPGTVTDGWAVVAIGLLGVHGLAVLLSLLEWGVGMVRFRRLCRDAQPASEVIDRAWDQATQGRGTKVRLLMSAAIDVPLVFGCFRPVVVVPRNLNEAGEGAVRFCLAHEWSHIVRADLLTWRCMVWCQSLLGFLPAYWALRKELRLCQDLLADDCSTRAGLDAVEYSELLVGFVRRRGRIPLAGALTFLDQPSQLSRRINMLLLRPVSIRLQCTWKFSLAAAAVAMLSAGIFSGVRIDAARADAADEAAKDQSDFEPAKPDSDLAVSTPSVRGLGVELAQATSADPPQSTAKSEEQQPKPTATQADPSGRFQYRCRIVDKKTGDGIAGARVVVRRSSLSAADNRFIEETKHATDDEGNYLVEIPPEQAADRMLYIELDVEHEKYAARKGFGYSFSMIRKNEGLGERPFFEKTELYEAEPVSGTAVSPEGKPLAGVKVQGFSMAERNNFDSMSFTETLTGADGKFQLNLHKGVDAVLWVIPRDFGIVEKFLARQRGDLGAIALPKGIRVHGRVKTADGQPAAGVAVNINFAGASDFGGLAVASSVSRGAISDKEGRFAFDPLPAGDYRVIPDEHLSDPLLKDRTVHSVPGVFLAKKLTLKEGVNPAPLEVQAVPHVVFHAQVVDSSGKKTRGHAFFLFGELDGEFWNSQGRPDPEGTVALRVPHGLQNARVDLMTNEHGALRYRRAPGEPLKNETRGIEFGTLNDDVVGFEIVRYQAPIVLISAVDEERQPVKDFRVAAAYPWGNQQYVLPGEVRSDLSFERQNDGRYRTSQMLPDEETTFTVNAPGFQAASEKLKLAEGQTKDLLLVLKKESGTKPAADRPEKTNK
ncbi:MAG: M56 family metallopeptidase [Planctomycetales bacterium]